MELSKEKISEMILSVTPDITVGATGDMTLTALHQACDIVGSYDISVFVNPSLIPWWERKFPNWKVGEKIAYSRMETPSVWDKATNSFIQQPTKDVHVKLDLYSSDSIPDATSLVVSDKLNYAVIQIGKIVAKQS